MQLNMNMLFLKKNGYIVIKNFYKPTQVNKINNILKNHFNWIKIKYPEYNKKKYTFDNPQNESLIKLFYDTIKMHPCTLELLSFAKTLNLVKKIYGLKYFGFLRNGYGFRLDYPQRSKFLTQLHQDYHANLGSPDGLVFYTPLTDVLNIASGPVVVFPKSHLEGIRKIKINKSYDVSTGYIIEKAEDEMLKFKATNLFIKSGDLAIFDFRLLHKSSFNKSSKVRISFISRFFLFDNKISIKNKFAGGLQEGNNFEKIHPELVD
jgi:ectoine hydroxylase-related dioxygenase (phytanoyl-CoA dioxygenase family)